MLHTDDSAAREAVGRVVRGEVSWRELATFGIAVRVTDKSVEELSGINGPILASAEDVAWGWIRNAARGEREFREWARFVHGAIGLVELDVDRHPLGERILDALWRASFEEPVTGEMVGVMRRVLSEH